MHGTHELVLVMHAALQCIFCATGGNPSRTHAQHLPISFTYFILKETISEKLLHETSFPYHRAVVARPSSKDSCAGFLALCSVLALCARAHQIW
jgi:hypothetical protein